MAAIDTTRFAPARTSAQGFGRIFKSVVTTTAALKEWNDKRVTRNALTRLTGRELNDIGLSRGDIDNI